MEPEPCLAEGQLPKPALSHQRLRLQTQQNWEGHAQKTQACAALAIACRAEAFEPQVPCGLWTLRPAAGHRPRTRPFMSLARTTTLKPLPLTGVGGTTSGCCLPVVALRVNRRAIAQLEQCVLQPALRLPGTLKTSRVGELARSWCLDDQRRLCCGLPCASRPCPHNSACGRLIDPSRAFDDDTHFSSRRKAVFRIRNGMHHLHIFHRCALPNLCNALLQVRVLYALRMSARSPVWCFLPALDVAHFTALFHRPLVRSSVDMPHITLGPALQPAVLKSCPIKKDFSGSFAERADSPAETHSLTYTPSVLPCTPFNTVPCTPKERPLTPTHPIGAVPKVAPSSFCGLRSLHTDHSGRARPFPDKVSVQNLQICLAPATASCPSPKPCEFVQPPGLPIPEHLPRRAWQSLRTPAAQTASQAAAQESRPNLP